MPLITTRIRQARSAPNINLDGLVANEELTFQYDDPPLRRIRRQFDFPSLTEPGLYVIDFIGNGKNSRVLVQKGKLHYVVRTTPAGLAFTVFDEQNRQLAERLFVDGRSDLPGPLHRRNPGALQHATRPPAGGVDARSDRHAGQL